MSEPIRLYELAELAGVAKSTVSVFFNLKFNEGQKGGYAKYRRACREPGKLSHSLKLLRGEVTPSILFKRLQNTNELEDNGH